MKLYFHEKPHRLRHLLTLALFAGVCISGAGPVARAIVFTFSGQAATGTIRHIEWRRISHRRSAPFYHFTYQTPTGEVGTGKTKYPGIFISQKNGDHVPVRYKDGDSEIVVLNHLWGVPALVLCVAGILFSLCVNWCRKNISFVIPSRTAPTQ